MSIALIVTRGYGNGTLTGSIKDVVLRGYDISDVIYTESPTKRMLFVNPENRTLSITEENRNIRVKPENRNLII